MAEDPAVTVTVAWKPVPQLLSRCQVAVQVPGPPVLVGVPVATGVDEVRGVPLAVVSGVGVGVTPPVATVMPLIFGFSVPEMNWITTWPLLLAVVLKVRAMARLEPPTGGRCATFRPWRL